MYEKSDVMTSFLKDIGRFFVPFLKPYKVNILLLLLLPVVWCFVETAAPYLIKMIIDSLAASGFQPEALTNTLLYTVLGYASLIFILEFSLRLTNYVWIKTFPHIRADIQRRILRQIQNLPLQFFHDYFAGDLISKYRSLAESFEKISSILLYGLYPTLLSFFFALTFIFSISALFAEAFLLWFLSMVFVTFLYFKKSALSSKEKAEIQNNIYGHVGNFMCNPLSFIMFSQNVANESAFDILIRRSVASAEKLEFITFKIDIFRSLCSWILLVCMILFLSYGWCHGFITLGDFAFIGAICFYVRRTVWMASVQLLDFFKELGATHEALSLISNTQRFEDRTYTSSPPSNTPFFESSLDLQNVKFSHDKQEVLFNTLDLHIPAGQKVGLIGPSGAGKTSLIHLLIGLYRPQQGSVKINGQDIREMPVEQVRSLFSYAPQSDSLLHRSIYENIAFGNASASQEDVYEAAEMCLCDEFISSLEKGYETIVGEGGYKLSGGQRQRIAIARAYIKKAPIFILDEATSGLEASLEELILDRLCYSLKSQTLIVISHRVSRLMKMERVLELKEGSIIRDAVAMDPYSHYFSHER